MPSISFLSYVLIFLALIIWVFFILICHKQTIFHAHGKNDFVEDSKILLDRSENNFVGS